MKDDYSPTQLLDVCKISPFDVMGSEKLNTVVMEILAAVVVKESGAELIAGIGEIVERHTKVSIGAALDKLHQVATTGKEFDGGKDGLDALCYHLSGSTCKKAMSALESVMMRFSSLRDEQLADAKRRGLL